MSLVAKAKKMAAASRAAAQRRKRTRVLGAKACQVDHSGAAPGAAKAPAPQTTGPVLGPPVAPAAKPDKKKPRCCCDQVAEAPAVEEAAEEASVGDHLRRDSEAAFKTAKKGISRLARREKHREAGAEEKLKEAQDAVQPPVETDQQLARKQVDSVVEQNSKLAVDGTQVEGDLKAESDEVQVEAYLRTKTVGGDNLGTSARQAFSKATRDASLISQGIHKMPPQVLELQAPAEPSEIERAPGTGKIDPGEGVVGQLLPEHTDFSEYKEQSDAILEKEQIREEHLAMVDEGDLAEAYAARKDLELKVEEGPAEIQVLEEQEKSRVQEGLRAEEAQERQKMRSVRRRGLRGARDRQKATAAEIHAERKKKVTDTVNGIYRQAKTDVDAEIKAFEDKDYPGLFEQCKDAAMWTFERAVQLRVDAIETDRHTSFGGGFLLVKDLVVGTDDLPAVKRVFAKEKKQFVAKIKKVTEDIVAASRQVVERCQAIVDKAKEDIKTYVDGLGPDLKEIGEKALGDIEKKFDALDRRVCKQEKAFQKKLYEMREQAFEELEKKIEQMKEEMGGLVSKVANFLLDAAIKFFKWVLDKAGFDSAKLMSILDKGKIVLKKIVTEPVGFIKNLVKAGTGGIYLFQKDLRKNILEGLKRWLSGAMAGAPVTLPVSWSLKGVVKLSLEILGLTRDHFRQRIAKRLGEDKMEIIERSVDFLGRLKSEGPMALWNMLVEKAAEIRDKVIAGVRNWAITELVKQGVLKLVKFLIPGSAVVEAIKAIYNTVMFFVENWRRIVDFVKSVFDSIGNIARGMTEKAAQRIRDAMIMTIPIILAFLARMIDLPNIGKAVSKVIDKIRAPITKIVDKVIDKVVKVAEKVLGKAKKAGQAVVKGLVEWWKIRKKTRVGREKHTLLFTKKGTGHQLSIHSEPRALVDYVRELWQQYKIFKGKSDAATAAAAREHLVAINKSVRAVNQRMTRRSSDRKRKGKYFTEKQGKEIADHFGKISTHLESLPPELVSTLEGQGTIVRPKTKIDYGPQKVQFFDVRDNAGVVKTLRSEDGQSMNATVLSTVPDGKNTGSGATARSELYSVLDRRRGDQVVPGHLLNHQVYGTGSRTENLTPITRSVNTQMEDRLEDPLKEHVLRQNQVASYTVVADWGEKFHRPMHEGPDRHVPYWISGTLTLKKFDESKGQGKSPEELEKAKRDVKNWIPARSPIEGKFKVEFNEAPPASTGDVYADLESRLKDRIEVQPTAQWIDLTGSMDLRKKLEQAGLGVKDHVEKLKRVHNPLRPALDFHYTLTLLAIGSDSVTREELAARRGLVKATIKQHLDALIAAKLVAPAEDNEAGEKTYRQSTLGMIKVLIRETQNR